MINQILPILLIVAGGFFFIRNIMLYLDEAKLRNYLETNSKGKIWVKKFGMEKTMSLSKIVFLPIGSLIALALFVYGIYILLKML